MKNGTISALTTSFAIALISIALSGSLGSLARGADAQTPPNSQAAAVSLPAGVQDVVTLTRAGIGEDPILAKVKNAAMSYNLTAEQIIYLRDQGVSENVITALIGSGSAGNTPSAVAAASVEAAPSLPADTPPPLPSDTAAAAVAAVVPATPAQPVAQPGLNDGLLAYYPLNGNANDASGNGQNAGLMSSPPFSNSERGTALYLQANGKYVQLPNIRIGESPSFTMSLWAKIDGELGNDYSPLIGFGDWNWGRGFLGIGYNGNSIWFNCDGTFINLSPIPNQVWKHWAHFALVFDNGVLTGYVNGRAINQKSGVTANQHGIVAGLGIIWWDNGDSSATRFIGLINDVRIYGRALAATEIAQLADASKLPVPPVVQPSAPPPVATAPLMPPQGAAMPMPATETAPAAALETPAAAAPAQPEINFAYFHDQLAPYGQWVEVPGYGTCWYPAQVIAANPDWRPYYDMGHWTYTENGWFWASDYNWGDIPFHYGRWVMNAQYRWLWVPDYTWGPAWVAWRHAETDGCIGWAPLPFGAVWVDGGWRFHGRAVVDLGFDFGLGEDAFVFVTNDHFRDEGFFRLRGRPNVFDIRRDRVHEFFGRSVMRNDFRRDEHGRLINEGLGRERIEQLTGHRVETEPFEVRNPKVRPDPPREEMPAPGGRAPAPDNHLAPFKKVFQPPVAPVPAKPSTPAKSSAPAKPANNAKKLTP
jgi:hypothetical protein